MKVTTNTKSKKLEKGHNSYLFGWGFGRLEDEQKPVWTSLLIFHQKSLVNYHARKLELLIPQNRHRGHQGGIWKIKGIPIFLEKYFFYLKSCLSKLGVTLLFFPVTGRYFLGAKHNTFKHSGYTTLYLCEFFGFLPKFGLFHFWKIPSDKRVRLDQLSGPSHRYYLPDPM